MIYNQIINIILQKLNIDNYINLENYYLVVLLSMINKTLITIIII